jgi:ABC transport system ATP-binding/permease protein
MSDQSGDSRDSKPRLRLSEADFAEPDTPRATEVRIRSAAVLVDGDRVRIPEGGLSIGSAPQSGLRIESDDVARHHAVIQPARGGYALVDTGEAATYVNGARLARHEQRPLARGDSIAIGSKVMYFAPPGVGTPLLPSVTPEDAGRIRATKDRFTIGRAGDCTLVLDHPTVSAHHAVIRKQDDETWIEDLGSSIGTRVNGMRLRRARLEAGDQIGIGPYRIVYDGEELIEREPGRGLPISCAGLSVVVGDLTILQPTTLNISPGQLVAIIGESGAGKSTLLKLLAGVTKPSAGVALVGGENVENRLSDIGYVPQFDIVHGRLTAREALDFAAQLRLPADLSGEDRHARVDEILAQLQLAERADTLVDLLSGGQRKRVAVGVELLHRPGVLFLDEPTTGLDPGLERTMMELFRLLASSGQTVVLVTHATGSIALADRVIAMGGGGVIRYDGKPEEMLRAFQVDAYDSVYGSLTTSDSVAVQEPAESAAPTTYTGTRQKLSQPFGYQAQVLARRYALLMSRDRRHLKGALIQLPILALLTAFLFPLGVFGDLMATGKAAQLLFMMTTVALWLGSINAAREIVKERSVFARELAVGVRLPAYIASKLSVLFVFSTIQTSLFALIVVIFQPLHQSMPRAFLLWAVLVLTSWIGVLMGLLVSATAASEDQATGIIPLLLIPQLLLGGAIVTLKDMPLPVHGIAELVPARWGFSGTGSAMHMDERLHAALETATVPTPDHYGSFFDLPFMGFLVVTAAFGVGLTLLLQHFLRPDPEPLHVITRRWLQNFGSGPGVNARR